MTCNNLKIRKENDIKMNQIKIYVFKESGKWYTEEDFDIPDHLNEVYEVVDYIESHFRSYIGMHLFMLLDEPFIRNGYPNMIPADKRMQPKKKGNELAPDSEVEVKSNKEHCCEPKFLGYNAPIGCRIGECSCGNIVRGYEKYCDECGVKFDWDNVGN